MPMPCHTTDVFRGLYDREAFGEDPEKRLPRISTYCFSNVRRAIGIGIAITHAHCSSKKKSIPPFLCSALCNIR